MSWNTKDQGRAERGYHHGNLKEALLQAALDLIAKKGPAGFTFADAARLAPRLGLSRRDFLRTSGGMATSLLAMNAVFGRFFDVLPVEAAEPSAFKARTGDAFFIFDVQLHYVGAGYDPSNEEAARRGVSKTALLGLRQNSRRLNPKLAADRGTLADLAWANMVKEVFLDSATDIGLISTPPGPYPQEAVVPPKEMTHIRDEINRVTQSRRMLAHGLITPQLGQADLDFMDQQAATLNIDAWKGYTGAAPKGFDRGWFVDDEKIAYPMLERARKLGVKRICLHKGLPLGPVADYNHPRDVIKAARDFPDLDFVLYHAGLLTMPRTASADVPWTTEFCQMKKKEPALTNIYMELGSTFGQLATTNPTACAHLLGQVVDAFGADHVLWGTDSIWYGTDAITRSGLAAMIWSALAAHESSTMMQPALSTSGQTSTQYLVQATRRSSNPRSRSVTVTLGWSDTTRCGTLF